MNEELPGPTGTKIGRASKIAKSTARPKSKAKGERKQPRNRRGLLWGINPPSTLIDKRGEDPEKQ